MANIREGLLNLVSGAPNSPYRGLLSPAASERARNTSLTDASIAMMLGSTGAPGAPAPTFMQALAGGLQSGRNSYGQVADAEIINRQALQQIQAAQKAQLGQEALARHFAVNPITPESLKTGARIAASFSDMATYKALLDQIATITPDAVTLTDNQKDYQAYKDSLPPGEIPKSWLEYQKAVSGKTPPAEAKPDRIPEVTRADMLIVTIDPITKELSKTPPPFGTTWDKLAELESAGVTIESQSQNETTAQKTRQAAAKKYDVQSLSTDLMSVHNLLMSGQTGGIMKTWIGRATNDETTAALGNLYSSLKSQFTLTKLAEAKAKGITFGALSDGEREMVARSVGVLEQTQNPQLQLVELSRIVGAFARHGLVDTSGFSNEFLQLAEKYAREGLAELPTTTSSAKSTGSVVDQYGLEQ
jgi:hypothetical protein